MSVVISHAQSAPDELEPAAIAKRTIRSGMWLIVVAFGGFGTWAALAPISGAVIVPGTVKVEAYRKTVQHLEGGIVEEILVRNGERVREGQKLLVLDSVQAVASVGVLQTELDAEIARQQRLQAEAARAETVTYSPQLLKRRSTSPELGEMMDAENNLFVARRRLIDNQANILRAQIGAISEEINGLQAQVRSADQHVGFIREQLQINDTLNRGNFVARTRVLDYRRQLAQKEEDRGEYVAKIGVARQKIKDIELRIENLYNTYVREASDALNASPRRIAALKEQIRPRADQLKRAVVVAPIAGTVVDVKIHTSGGVIAPGEHLMDIVPEDAGLIVEGKMRVRDIRHVRIGSQVDLQLVAYKRRVTPRVPGTLTYISADSLSEHTSAGEQPYYLVQIMVKKEDLQEAGDLELTPGMPVDAFIRTTERTMIEYLSQPITDRLQHAFRE